MNRTCHLRRSLKIYLTCLSRVSGDKNQSWSVVHSFRFEKCSTFPEEICRLVINVVILLLHTRYYLEEKIIFWATTCKRFRHFVDFGVSILFFIYSSKTKVMFWMSMYLPRYLYLFILLFYPFSNKYPSNPSHLFF